MKAVWILIGCLITLSVICGCSAFQSDELPDDEEWGFTGGEPEGLKERAPEIIRPTIPRRSANVGGAASPIETSYSKVNITLEHSFSQSPFSPAGLFTARLKTSQHGSQTLIKLRFTRNELTRNEQERFMDLLRKDDFYRIRLVSNVLNPGKEYVFSSIKARCLVRDDLVERFIIHMEGVNIIAVTYASPGACPCPRPLKMPNKWAFNSHAVLKSSEQASRIPLVTETVTGVVGEVDELETPPERSLWAKYWMYLIPLGLIVMNAMAQAMNMPEAQTAGQQAGQTSAQAPQRISQANARRR